MPRKTRNQMEFHVEELIRRLEGVAKHASGEKHQTMHTTRMARPPREKSPFNR